LPQDFKNSLTIFRTALASDLKVFSDDQPGCILLQYIDDLLMAAPTREDCMEGNHLLFSLLWKARYKVTRKKVQIYQNTVKDLGFHMFRGIAGSALPERKHAVSFIPAPNTHLQINEFWEAAGFC
jgi:hypothetical protein